VYQQLAHAGTVPWDRVELFFADERAVPPTDPRSNYRLVADTLGPRFQNRPEAIHRMEGESPDLDRAAANYEGIIPARFALLVLGMGEDGHTASLFPGHPAVGEGRRRVLAVQVPASPPARLTITPRVIAEARTVLVLVAGAAKAAAAQTALRGPLDPVRCPAQLAREGTWILDRPAAALLGDPRTP
jgi:6-phosphogluconolactonase